MSAFEKVSGTSERQSPTNSSFKLCSERLTTANAVLSTVILIEKAQRKYKNTFKHLNGFREIRIATILPQQSVCLGRLGTLGFRML